MRKLEIKNADVIKVALQQEIGRSEESRYDHRLHGVLLVCNNFSCNQVASLLGDAPRTVAYWVHRFQQYGFAGLREGKHPGRPVSLSQEQIERLGKDLRCSPRDLGYEQNLWDGILLSHHLCEVYSINLGVRQCQRLFRKLGFRRRKPRPLIAKADPEAQRVYKKNSQS